MESAELELRLLERGKPRGVPEKRVCDKCGGVPQECWPFEGGELCRDHWREAAGVR